MDVLFQQNARLFIALRFSLFFMEDHVMFKESFLLLCNCFKSKPTSRPTKLRPDEFTHFRESTKIGPHENK